MSHLRRRTSVLLTVLTLLTAPSSPAHAGGAPPGGPCRAGEGNSARITAVDAAGRASGWVRYCRPYGDLWHRQLLVAHALTVQDGQWRPRAVSPGYEYPTRVRVRRFAGVQTLHHGVGVHHVCVYGGGGQALDCWWVSRRGPAADLRYRFGRSPLRLAKPRDLQILVTSCGTCW
ncbi:hypothetical protein GCM10010124_09010 [Pilimelia terevasa]|uniref:Secreted protein n=1 Tax=Pilimelia terevasa TaxID=53372 RepID=A0A8J3BPI7_9ACTN|nr:hypothetical protein [Pilimelia terevasa]GGK18594.1 hypothetical protein GCM10010124_09010 [Pilimelia terevasa]